jgi:hypothetical protein
MQNDFHSTWAGRIPAKGWLPSELSSLEESFGSKKAWMDWIGELREFLTWNAPRPEVRTDVTITPSMEAGAAVEEWQRLSNGRIEAVVAAGAGIPLEPDLTPATLLALPLECLEGFGPGSRYRFQRVSSMRALFLLYKAALSPCAYGPGSAPELARLKTWISATALVGASPGASFAEVSALAMEAAWYWFVADTEWFYRQDWASFGLVALRPGCRSLGILIAIDTD